MAKREIDGPDLGPLEIAVGGIAPIVVTVVLILLCFVSEAVFGSGISAVVARVAFPVLAVLLVATVVRHLRWRAKGRLVRLDDTGVTVLDGRTVGWAEIREVREVHKRATEGLVFLPRDDAELPVFSITLFVLRRRSQAARMTRLWGSPLVLVPGHLNVSRTQIVDAVRRFSGGIPILDEERELVVS
jgi:hypothetical protein